MSATDKVLLLGGTGRTGGRVLMQLLERGVPVRAIVRSAARLPEGAAGAPGLEVIESDPLALSDAEWKRLLDGCASVVSCLGHNTTVAGIFGPPRDLVAPVVARVCRAARSSRPVEPIKLVLMSTVSVLAADGRDARRGGFERAVVRALCAVVPPARDNQNAADFLQDEVGPDDPFVQWVVVRPDTLREGDVSDYALHEGLVASLAKPDDSAMANVAHFMCELVGDRQVWDRWRGRLPVIINAVAA